MDAIERQDAIAKRRKSAKRTERLWLTDGWREFEVWQVPVELLVLNVENRRFATERRYYEAKLGRPLDPENTEADAESVESILLDGSTTRRLEGNRIVGKPNKDTLALEADWLNRKQERPLWIRPDGTVRNGNRRLAIVRRLRRKLGQEGRSLIEAVILEDDIDELTLFRMEQHEQLTEDYKVLYTDINLLLAIRDAAETAQIDWGDDKDIDRVAGELQGIIGNDKAYARIQLNAIKYMDAFLDDVEQPDAYELLIGQIERFRDIGKAMNKVGSLAPQREEDMLEVCFAAIRVGLPHGEIRVVKRMFEENRARFDQLIAQVREDEDGWEPTGIQEAIQPSPDGDLGEGELSEPLPDTEIDDEDEEEEPPGPNMPDYEPGVKVRRTFDTHLDGFKASTGTDVLKLLAAVQHRLDTLSSSETTLLENALSEDVEGVEVGLQKIIEWVDRNRYLAQ